MNHGVPHYNANIRRCLMTAIFAARRWNVKRATRPLPPIVGLSICCRIVPSSFVSLPNESRSRNVYFRFELVTNIYRRSIYFMMEIVEIELSL